LSYPDSLEEEINEEKVEKRNSNEKEGERKENNNDERGGFFLFVGSERIVQKDIQR
jgi:hypothetical protein